MPRIFLLWLLLPFLFLPYLQHFAFAYQEINGLDSRSLEHHIYAKLSFLLEFCQCKFHNLLDEQVDFFHAIHQNQFAHTRFLLRNYQPKPNNQTKEVA